MSDTAGDQPEPAPAPTRSKEEARGDRHKIVTWMVVVSVATAVSAIALVASRSGANVPHKSSQPSAVNVARIAPADLYNEIEVPAEFRPWQVVDLHAKVSGYVSTMRVDIGDRVKAGELLALLEVPELMDQLEHDKATAQREAAEYRDAHLAYTRLNAANATHPNLIAQQDIDTAAAKDATAAAALSAANADVRKDQALAAYTHITAPFAGVITKRYADPGTLIQAGTSSNTQAMPLVRIADLHRLRLDFPVSVDYVSSIHGNQPVTLRVQSLGDQLVTGKVVRFTNDVNESTRTMTVEMDVDNPDLHILPGMYATVSLRVVDHPHALAVPVGAVPAGSNEVLIVDTAGRIERRAVTLGIETPTQYEVRSGLKAGDLVVVGNTADLVPGETVDPRLDSEKQPGAGQSTPDVN